MTFGKHFQIIFEHSPLGMMILDSTGRIILSNRTVNAMFERSKEELHGRTLQDLLHEEEIGEFEYRFFRLAEHPNGSFESEFRFLKGSEVRWCKLTMNNVATGNFSPFIYGIAEDITVRKSGVERLLKEKEVAERATQTKSAFLANMSHEIRTPIHTITGMTELLQETKLDAEQKEYSDQIRFSAEVLLGLINDILDFSKIEAGKLSLEILDCDFISLVEEAVDMVSLLAHKKNLEVLIDMGRGVPRWVKGDPVRIRQIIINLFNNAVKFTSQGEILVRTGLVGEDRGVPEVKVEVIDTGIGIPEEKLAMLFHAFTQVDSSTTRKFGGTGLGLSISKSLVKMMDGTIDVRSAKGQGSTFWFTLPLKPVPEREEDAEPVFEENFLGSRVLIVDDNRSSRGILSALTSDWFRRVETAENGRDALEKLARAAEEGDPFGLALVDLLMPGMDGWQLASEIHNDARINSCRLILMSPTGSGTEAKMKLLGWFDGYVNKPVKRRDLLECLASVAAPSSAAEDLREEEPEEVEELADESCNKRYSILVAEDHLVNQQLFQTILEKMGYTVFLAANGLEAVERAEKEKIDLVFMDMQMPEMNGYEASQRLRELGYEMPIVAVTANALKGEREICIEAGMNDYLTKPFKSRDLLPYLERWLPASEKTRERRSEPAEPAVESEAEPERTVFDLTEALDSFMGKKDVVTRVVKTFMEKLDAQTESMKAALIAGDWESLRIESHGIKGGSWNLSAKRLGDAAAELEQAAKDRNARTAAEHLMTVEREIKVFKDYVGEMPEFGNG